MQVLRSAMYHAMSHINAYCRWPRYTRPTSWQGLAWVAVRRKKRRRRPHGLRLRKKSPPVGCARNRSSSKPFAVAAFALGRYRGCGRNPLARICAQREPSFSPLGTALNTVVPKGLLMAGNGKPANHQETLRRERKRRTIRNALGAIHGEVAFSSRSHRGHGKTRTLSEKASRAEAPALWWDGRHVTAKSATWRRGSRLLRMS